ncbi:MAG: hypothetical protein QOH73_966, partial [Gaiellaceae bacterium]|nr:hypothetical protein [Gaiellaceae bacterium]
AGAETILAALVDAHDGCALTPAELGAATAERVGPWAVEETGVIQFGKPALRWRPLVGAAVAAGRLCLGPPRGSSSTYVRADQWLGGWREIDPETALAEAFRRYLTAYGPATTEDFAHWFGHGVDAVARELPGRIGEELEPVEVEGSACWLLAGDTTFPDRPAPSVRLLAHYDCYLIGAAPPGPSRDRLVPAAAGSRIFDRGGGPSPAVLVDGVVAGTWSRRARGKRLEIRIELFQSLSASQRRALESEVGRIGRFLGAEAQLTE